MYCDLLRFHSERGLSTVSRTFYLFARPGFVIGVARLFDFGGTLKIYNESVSEKEADAIALAQDWKAIADDLREAVTKYNALQELNA
jgi:hypothetical protein